ncbi:dynamin-like GTPase family protein [Thermosynechococcus sp. PP42]|uniref:dynamin-like GTPase family protein n=1 Tax=Thermosynechococcus sp. PP42 TaxID=3074083 RepID=UPI0028587AD4|nr:dynamin-like GTPase family protein [Thermosynechococcus sp. PP42]MDR5638530.1 dynamin-like GTPase family protein [Thermosynechococcus sp. PP42]
MSDLLNTCPNLQADCDRLLDLLNAEPKLRSFDITPVQTSLRKAVSPTFEIVFAGPFSAGKSMLINALLERELLYSAQGHATGTICRVAYAEPDRERAVLTFYTEGEIQKQVTDIGDRLRLGGNIDINNPSSIQEAIQFANQIIEQEGGEGRSQRAREANGLKLLLQGRQQNAAHIHPTVNNSFSMDGLGFGTIAEASAYARQGSNSAVLKKIEYYCHHPLLAGGNVLIDTPGIDAPIKEHAELAYRCINDPEASAVIVVYQIAASGEIIQEEIELLENIKNNPGLRDRVFHVINRIDQTWFDADLREKVNNTIAKSFYSPPDRVYRTSGLLGFYGSQLLKCSDRDRYGLDSLFANEISKLKQRTDAPKFISEFLRYCIFSYKLPSKFRIQLDTDKTPLESYELILQRYGHELIQHMIKDSEVEIFRSDISRYLREEKYPQLLEQLVSDLQNVCINLSNLYQPELHELKQQPNDIEALKQTKLLDLSQELKIAGDEFYRHIDQFLNRIKGGQSPEAEQDYKRLKNNLVTSLEQLLRQFSVATIYQQALDSHPTNSVVPVMGILAEAFYYLANGLKKTLVESSQEVIKNLFKQLRREIYQQPYYRELFRLLGNDSGIDQMLAKLEEEVLTSITTVARIECDRYVREREDFYHDTQGVMKLREVLRKACNTFDASSMFEAETELRELLKMDFVHKIKKTIEVTYRAAIATAITEPLLTAAKQHSQEILQQQQQAREHLGKTLEKEAAESIEHNAAKLKELEGKIAMYNEAVTGINRCLEQQGRDRQKLPLIL